MQQIQYASLERIRVPRPVDRLAFIEGRVAGKRVFDLGALDETAYVSKQNQGNWLHARLCGRADSVLGIDNSVLIPADGLETVYGGKIIRADIYDLAPVIDVHGCPEMIVAGELIEHLSDTFAFLRSLKENPRLRGVELVFSTPNACCWHNGLVGLLGCESMHVDHLQIYSYKTLRTLFDRADIQLEALVPWHVRFYEMLEDSKGMKWATIRAFQGVVNTLEWCSPLLSAGWIGVARL